MSKGLGIFLCAFLLLEIHFINGRNVATKPSRPKDLGGSGPHTFDYLLGEQDDLSSDADVLFVDYDIDEDLIRDLLSDGKRVICYVNVGAWEEWRSDADAFPSSVLGNDYEGWPGENWLDIRKLTILLPIMRNRFRAAARKGCEGIDPDNMNGYTVDTGFPLTFDDQIAYNEAISHEINASGMLAGLKNDNDQAWQLSAYTDFAVVESCAAYEECENFEAFIEADKPVFAIEYTDLWDEEDFENDVCPFGEETGISFILKDLDLHNDFILSCLSFRSEGPKHYTRRNATTKLIHKSKYDAKLRLMKRLGQQKRKRTTGQNKSKRNTKQNKK